MLLGPGLSLLVETIDIGLELSFVDSPDAPPTYLDSRQFPRADEGIHLGNADTEVRGNVVQREKPRFDRRFLGSVVFGHLGKLPPQCHRSLHLRPFASVEPRMRAVRAN